MFKDILIHLDGDAEDEHRLAYAVFLAQQNDGHLTGLYCNMMPEIMPAGAEGLGAADMIAEMMANAVEAGAREAERLEKRMRKLNVLNELRHLDLTATQAGGLLAAEARVADVFVATRPYGHASGAPHLVEQVMFNSGRATLLVPPGGTAKPHIETILLAWRNTREAARAVSEAMPLLVRAKSVVVVTVASGEASESLDEEPEADIARHLDRHGVNVELREVAGWSDPAKALINEQEQAMAGLIVMGVYGHSRFREWALGGVTRTVLGTAQVPVLVAH